MDDASDNARHQHRHEGDEYRRIELITGTTRRRRWTAAEKASMVAESLRPGINISAFARRCGVSPGLLQTWRRKAKRETAVFVPLRLEEPADVSREATAAAAMTSGTAMQVGTLEIESGRLRVRFDGPVDAAALRLVLAHIGCRT